MNEPDLENRESDILRNFIEITGMREDLAAEILRINEYNLEKAINYHLEFVYEDNNLPSCSTTTRVACIAPNQNPAALPSQEEDEVRAPIPSRREQLVTPDDDNFRFRKRRAAVFSVCPLRNFAREAEYQEEQLNICSSTSSNAPVKRPRLEDLYRPPVDLLFGGTFRAAQRYATEKKRWLMVNLQDNAEFKSQILNRDVWTYQELRDIIQEYFVLWQVSIDNVEGVRFKTFYRVCHVPYVCILDPRTGEHKMAFDVVTPQCFTSEIEDFLVFYSCCPDEEPNPSTRPATAFSVANAVIPTRPEIKDCPSAQATSELSEDQQMAMAIENSLKETQEEKRQEYDNQKKGPSTSGEASLMVKIPKEHLNTGERDIKNSTQQQQQKETVPVKYSSADDIIIIEDDSLDGESGTHNKSGDSDVEFCEAEDNEDSVEEYDPIAEESDAIAEDSDGIGEDSDAIAGESDATADESDVIVEEETENERSEEDTKKEKTEKLECKIQDFSSAKEISAAESTGAQANIAARGTCRSRDASETYVPQVETSLQDPKYPRNSEHSQFTKCPENAEDAKFPQGTICNQFLEFSICHQFVEGSICNQFVERPTCNQFLEGPICNQFLERPKCVPDVKFPPHSACKKDPQDAQEIQKPLKLHLSPFRTECGKFSKGTQSHIAKNLEEQQGIRSEPNPTFQHDNKRPQDRQYQQNHQCQQDRQCQQNRQCQQDRQCQQNQERSEHLRFLQEPKSSQNRQCQQNQERSEHLRFLQEPKSSQNSKSQQDKERVVCTEHSKTPQDFKCLQNSQLVQKPNPNQVFKCPQLMQRTLRQQHNVTRRTEVPDEVVEEQSTIKPSIVYKSTTPEDRSLTVKPRQQHEPSLKDQPIETGLMKQPVKATLKDPKIQIPLKNQPIQTVLMNQPKKETLKHQLIQPSELQENADRSALKDQPILLEENTSAWDPDASARPYHTYLGRKDDAKTKLQLRLPNGKRKHLSWPCSTKLKAIKLYLETEHPEMTKDSFKIIGSFPRQNILELDDNFTLNDAKLHPSAILHLHSHK